MYETCPEREVELTSQDLQCFTLQMQERSRAYLTRPAMLHTPDARSNAEDGENKEGNKRHQPPPVIRFKVEDGQDLKNEEDHVLTPGENHGRELASTVCLGPGAEKNLKYCSYEFTPIRLNISSMPLWILVQKSKIRSNYHS